MLRRALTTAFLATALLPWAASAMPAGAPVARQSLALCGEADSRPQAERLHVLDQGLALAEEATGADETDAAAHFAVFCNLGKRMKIAGVGLGSLFAVQRLRREIDLTLASAPDDPDALIAKAAFLLQLPRLLGGDPEEGARLLRAALQLAPDHPAARALLRGNGDCLGGQVACADE